MALLLWVRTLKLASDVLDLNVHVLDAHHGSITAFVVFAT